MSRQLQPVVDAFGCEQDEGGFRTPVVSDPWLIPQAVYAMTGSTDVAWFGSLLSGRNVRTAATPLPDKTLLGRQGVHAGPRLYRGFPGFAVSWP